MRLKRDFFTSDTLKVAPSLLGCYLVRKFDGGRKEARMITETEAYGGKFDLASHARFGKTKRNSVMWEKGGLVYVYFVYGMYFMFNITTGKRGEPQAVLIRSVQGISGPGRVGKWLNLDKSFYGEDIVKSKRVWIEKGAIPAGFKIERTPRIGVSYAGCWAKKKWRFLLTREN